MHTAQSTPTRLIIVVGPTGIGKTSVGIRLARHFGGEIISADSMQIYRHMDIGTAKPTREEQRQARHHLIDIVDPDEPFDAARFGEMARQTITRLGSRGKVPVIVGGTGFYIKALLHGLCPAPPREPALQVRLRADLAREGSAALHGRLARCDPESAARIHSNDSYRILRALETVISTGRSLSAWQKDHGFPVSPYHFLRLGLELQRTKMYARINARAECMVHNGLLDEVRRLLARGYGPDLKPMQSLGYRHMIAHIHGNRDWAETIRTMQRDTRHYAKRQLTWFKSEADTIWIAPEDLDAQLPRISAFLE